MNVPASDHYAAYRKYRAARHEMMARTAATLLCSPRSPTSFEPCRIRKCWRDRVCSGPMRACARLLDKQRALQRLGLPGPICTDLPACLAEADAEDFEMVKEALDECEEMYKDRPHLSWAKQSANLRAALRQPIDSNLIDQDVADDL